MHLKFLIKQINQEFYKKQQEHPSDQYKLTVKYFTNYVQVKSMIEFCCVNYITIDI